MPSQSASSEIMRLLVVEDDKKLASYIVKGFQEAGFVVDHCADGEPSLRKRRAR